jgi:hypothetical protein
MTFALPVDRNWKPIPLFPWERPRVVQRLTTVTTSAVNSSALNVDTKMIRLFSESYDAYVYIKDSVFTGTATNAVHHIFVPANTLIDYVLPWKPVATEQFTLSVIADGTVPKFMIYEI